jgi:hypothetical protein
MGRWGLSWPAALNSPAPQSLEKPPATPAPQRPADKNKADKIAPFRFAPLRNFSNPDRPFCAAITYKACTRTPPAVLAVGAGEKGSNPHAPFSPELTVKAKSKNSAKTPAPLPSQTVTFTRIMKHRGEMVVLCPTADVNKGPSQFLAKQSK